MEIFINGAWGTVCDDAWEASDALVVCNQLGLTGPETPEARLQASFGEGSGLIHFRQVACTGIEAILANCSHETNTDVCQHSEDAGVVCPGYTGETIPLNAAINYTMSCKLS